MLRMRKLAVFLCAVEDTAMSNKVSKQTAITAECHEKENQSLC